MNQLHLYNSLTRSIDSFQPRTPGKVRVYSCGPTVYSRQHLGNMRPYVLADLLTRVLRLEGLEVEHVINITDVGEKISKSQSHEQRPPNLDDLAQLGVTPGGFRYYLYTAHYRSPLSLSGEALRGAEAARRRLRAIARAGSAESEATWGAGSHRLEALRDKFRAALRDDLDAPRALAVLWEIAEQPDPLPLRARAIRELGESIGLELTGPAPVVADDAEVEALVARRNMARDARDFALSDAIRAELSAKGVVIEDFASGSSWRRA